MSIEQVNSSDFDYDKILATQEVAYIGKSNITISEYDTSAACVVKVGSRFEVGGSLFKVLTSDESPTGYSSISNSTTFYLYYDVSEEEFAYAETVPTWSDAYQGWYNGADRYFFSMYKDSGGTLYQDKDFLISKSNSRIHGNLFIEDGLLTLTTATGGTYQGLKSLIVNMLNISSLSTISGSTSLSDTDTVIVGISPTINNSTIYITGNRYYSAANQWDIICTLSASYTGAARAVVWYYEV